MSKPRIYAGCKAGCLWETVHKSDFDEGMALMGTHLEAKPDEDGKLYLEVGKIYKVYAPKNTDSTAFDSELYIGWIDTDSGEVNYHIPNGTTVSFPTTKHACDNYFTIQIADYKLTNDDTNISVLVRVNGTAGNEYKLNIGVSFKKELLTENALYLTNVTRALVVNNDVSLPYSDEAVKELQEEVKALEGQNEYIGSYAGTDYTENTIQSVLSNFVKSVENRDARDGDIVNIVSAGADVDYSGEQWIFSGGIFKYYIDFENHSVIDNLDSDSAIDGLSARMGKLLNQEVSGISTALGGCIGDVEDLQNEVHTEMTKTYELLYDATIEEGEEVNEILINKDSNEQPFNVSAFYLVISFPISDAEKTLDGHIGATGENGTIHLLNFYTNKVTSTTAAKYFFASGRYANGVWYDVWKSLQTQNTKDATVTKIFSNHSSMVTTLGCSKIYEFRLKLTNSKIFDAGTRIRIFGVKSGGNGI